MLEKVKEIVAENLGADINTLTEETSIKDDLGADSLDKRPGQKSERTD